MSNTRKPPKLPKLPLRQQFSVLSLLTRTLSSSSESSIPNSAKSEQSPLSSKSSKSSNAPTPVATPPPAQHVSASRSPSPLSASSNNSAKSTPRSTPILPRLPLSSVKSNLTGKKAESSLKHKSKLSTSAHKKKLSLIDLYDNETSDKYQSDEESYLTDPNGSVYEEDFWARDSARASAAQLEDPFEEADPMKLGSFIVPQQGTSTTAVFGKLGSFPIIDNEDLPPLQNSDEYGSTESRPTILVEEIIHDESAETKYKPVKKKKGKEKVSDSEDLSEASDSSEDCNETPSTRPIDDATAQTGSDKALAALEELEQAIYELNTVGPSDHISESLSELDTIQEQLESEGVVPLEKSPYMDRQELMHDLQKLNEEYPEHTIEGNYKSKRSIFEGESRKTALKLEAESFWESRATIFRLQHDNNDNDDSGIIHFDEYMVRNGLDADLVEFRSKVTSKVTFWDPSKNEGGPLLSPRGLTNNSMETNNRHNQHYKEHLVTTRKSTNRDYLGDIQKKVKMRKFQTISAASRQLPKESVKNLSEFKKS